MTDNEFSLSNDCYLVEHTPYRGVEIVFEGKRREIKSRELAFQMASILFAYATRPGPSAG